MMHTFQSASAAGAPIEKLSVAGGGVVEAPTTTYGEAKKKAVEAVTKTFKESGCNEECIIHQLDYYHKRQGMNDNTKMKAVQTGDYDPASVDDATRVAMGAHPRFRAVRLLKRLGLDNIHVRL